MVSRGSTSHLVLMKGFPSGPQLSRAAVDWQRVLTSRRIKPSIGDEVTPKSAAGSFWAERCLVADLSVRLMYITQSNA